MADDVLLRNVVPNLCSATQGTLAVKDRSCYVGVTFHFLGSKELVVLFSFFVYFLIALSLPGTLVSATEVVPACSRQHCVNEVCAYFIFFALRRIVEDTELYNVIHISSGPHLAPLVEIGDVRNGAFRI